MIESRLSELLERAGEQTSVGPAPIEALRVGAARRRRRRTVAWSASAAAAVAAVVGVTTVLVPQGRDSGDSPPAATPAPVALRVVGLGHAAIAVPKSWGLNQSRCGTPLQDTVLLDDPSARLYCGFFRHVGVESVTLTNGTPTVSFHADETFSIDGVRAERQRTKCEVGTLKVTVCAGAVGIPSLRVWFRADSSTSAEEVDRILERIVIVHDQVGVLSYQSLSVSPSKRLDGDMYAAALTQIGLKPRIKTTRSPSYTPGEILGVTPAPGTMLAPGAPVTITVAGG